MERDYRALERRESADTSTIDTCLIPFKPSEGETPRKARERGTTRSPPRFIYLATRRDALKGRNYFHEFQAGRGSSPFVGLLSRSPGRCSIVVAALEFSLYGLAACAPSVAEKRLHSRCAVLIRCASPPGQSHFYLDGVRESPGERSTIALRYRSRATTRRKINRRGRDSAARLNRANHSSRQSFFALFLPSLFRGWFPIAASRVQLHRY